ncbi:MAG: hypothetical protein KF773_41415 [Deltaproteobacteria bacterium]|nr:hypothetical protein [Deltaproteobacteria bacterium]
MASVLGGCFYTDRINQRPSIDILPDSSAPVFRGDHVLLHAVANDPENQVVSFAWRAYACTDATTPSGCDAEPFFTSIEQHASFDAPPFRADGTVPTSAIRVVLEAKDELGATARPSQELVIPVLNRAPTVMLTPVLLYGGVVGTPLQVFARFTDGDDPLDRIAVAWKAFSPQQTTFELRDLGGVTDPDPKFAQRGVELTPNVPGEWDVQVTLADPLGNAVTEHVTVVVAQDRAPCLAQWAPIAPVGGATLPLSGPTLFQVPLVADDLDPYPQGTLDARDILGSTRFVWSILPPGGTRTVLADATGNRISLDPATFAPGSRVELRVEIFDRKGTPISCADGDQTCSTISTDCIQRQTWRLEVL